MSGRTMLHMRLSQPARFLLAGGSAALVNWLVRFPLSIVLPFAAAVVAANIIGMIYGFFVYRAFVFTGHSRRVAHQVRDFVVVNLVGIVVVAVVAVALRAVLERIVPGAVWIDGLAHAIGIGVGAVANFFGHKHITFV